jgi:hypothetical protein
MQLGSERLVPMRDGVIGRVRLWHEAARGLGGRALYALPRFSDIDLFGNGEPRRHRSPR